MPVYDYMCQRCGPFTALRAMADFDMPLECSNCGGEAPRAFLTAPYVAAMPAERRVAHATNERSASAPLTLSGARQTHGAACRCCSGKSLRPDQRARGDTDAKSFPTRRPWMISH
jgi:putative FmdB family regulatory protein